MKNVIKFVLLGTLIGMIVGNAIVALLNFL